MATIKKCFGALVASGNSDRCDALRSALRNTLVSIDHWSGENKTMLYKFGRKEYPNFHEMLRHEIALELKPFFKGVPKRLLKKRPPKKISNNWRISLEQFFFSDTLEQAMSKGLWNGTVGKC